MKKTAIAIATAASLSLFAGPLVAGNNASTSADAGVSSGQAGASASQSGSVSTGQTGAGMGETSGAVAGSQPDFDQMDSNGDGQLDEDELNTYGSTAAGQGAGEDGESMMERYDTDGDGSVSEQELQQGNMSGEEDDVKTGIGTDSED
jgi:hypothetical protein